MQPMPLNRDIMKGTERTAPAALHIGERTLPCLGFGVSPCHPNGLHVPTNLGDYDTSFVEID